MFISREFLNRYVSIKDISDEDLASLLTQLGLEVESTKKVASLHPNIVVGKIVEIGPHPKADKLRICKVDCGAESILQIVCGAANARQGLFVALACEGSELGGAAAIKIKTGEIRGELSQGMLCSEKELGLSDEDSGIMELTSKHAVGTRLCDTDIGSSDCILELSITPNRGDCLSYIGVARDLGAKLRRSVNKPTLTLSEIANCDAQTFDHLEITLAPDAACGRFVGLYLGGLIPANTNTIPKSPLWLRRFLLASGMRSINLVVDVANFVMLEFGQPVHTYDKKGVEGGMLRVDLATLGQKITTLDGQTQTLRPGDLIIADASKVLGIAGVMGGQSSEIKEHSQELLLEVAHFNPQAVRRCAKQLNLHSEASARFERGIDIGSLDQVAVRFAKVLSGCYKELGFGGLLIPQTLVDVYPKEVHPARVAVRLERVKKILALPHLSLNNCVEDLSALGLNLLDKTEERALFEIPLHRNDLTREIDLIEEIARMEGFEKIPYQLPKMEIRPNKEDPFISFSYQVKTFLAGAGLCEIITNPFCGIEVFKNLGLEATHPLWPSLALKNPISEADPFLAPTLLPNLLRALGHNHHRGFAGSALFQMSRGYRKWSATPEKHWSPYFQRLHEQGRHLKGAALTEQKRPIERMLLTGAIDSPAVSKEWSRPAKPADFFDAKGLLQRLCRTFLLGNLECELADAKELPFLSPSSCTWLYLDGNAVGYMGYLHPRAQLQARLGTENILLFEIDLEATFASKESHALKIDAPTQHFPHVQRDFAFVVDRELNYRTLAQWIEAAPAKRHFKSLHLFDIYEGAPLPEGKKSLGLSLTFASIEKTLTDQEVEKESQSLLNYLQKEYQVGLR